MPTLACKNRRRENLTYFVRLSGIGHVFIWPPAERNERYQYIARPSRPGATRRRKPAKNLVRQLPPRVFARVVRNRRAVSSTAPNPHFQSPIWTTASESPPP